MTLQVTQLCKTYAATQVGGEPVRVLHNIDLQVNAGEFVAITGGIGRR